MDTSVLTWIFIGVGVIVLAAIVVGYLSTRGPADVRALTSGWREVARRTRVNFTAPQGALDTARLHGTHRGREVAAGIRIRAAYGPHGQELRTYTRFEAALANPKRAFLRVNTKGKYRKTDQYLGQPVRELGDPQIDGRYDIKCIPHDLAERLVGYGGNLRDDLLALKRGGYIEIELEGGAVSLEESGVETRPETLIGQFDLLCDLCDSFERLKI